MKHWCKIPLDNYSSCWIRNVDLDNNTLTYLIMDSHSNYIERERTVSFIYKGMFVLFGSIEIELDVFSKVVQTLENYETV